MQEVRIDWGIRSALGSSVDTLASVDLQGSQAVPRGPGALELSAGHLDEADEMTGRRFTDMMGLPVRTDSYSRTSTPVDFVQMRCCVIM
jgi:hypothetical protein